MISKHFLPVAALSLAAAALLGGCGDNDPPPAPTTDATAAATTTGVETPTTTTAEPGEAEDSAPPQESPSSTEGESPEAGGSGSSAGQELTDAAQEGLNIFLPAGQEATDVSCAVTDEQKQSGNTVLELACTYEAGGITRSQVMRGVDTGEGPPKVLPAR